MSRQIKFRGYVKNIDGIDDIGIGVPHKGHFVYGDLVHGDNFDCIMGGLIEATDEYATPEWWQTIEAGTADQFTDLKDIHGQEIYEGDIVFFKYRDEENRIQDFTGKVVFDTGCFYATYGAEYDNPPLLSNALSFYQIIFRAKNLKIIGNIHEGPELLEAKK